ncbi:NF-kappa-B inhibitor beta, partial [Cuculus canorus]|uniref:NF-kappa-B inhibitor beta n=1 Tax=Cuculus canorus TaxID=55661 RepID=UPI0023AB069A
PVPGPEEGKRLEADEWCDSGLGSLGEGQVAPLASGPDEEEEEEEEGGASAWLRHVLGFVTEDGDTALHLAVIHEHEPFLDSILRHTAGSAFLDLQNDLGQSALHIAVILGLPGFVRKLRAAGAGLGLRERGGQTPLHLACREGRSACARLLLGGPPAPHPDHSHQLESRNYDGLTPLHVAVLRGDLELVELLLAAGADPDVPEPSGGRAPLHLAVEAQSAAVAEALLRAGAHPSPRMFGGCTPLRSARLRPDPRLPPLLRRFGAPDSPPDASDASDTASDSQEEDEEEEDEYDDIVINRGH